jgi:hypothetical protein
MNAGKTQLLLSSHAGNVSETTVEVDGNVIHPGDVIELLGVRYDRKLSTSPHIKSLLAAVKQWALVVARLANHLPRGAYLRQLSYGLVMGKFLHALAAMARPRLEQEDNASVTWTKIQVAFNNVARSITGARRRDHVTLKDLLDLAGIESANRMDGEGHRGRDVKLLPQRRREGRHPEPCWENPFFGQEDDHCEDWVG